MSAALLRRMVGETSARVFFNVHMDLDLGASTGLIGTVSAVAQLIAIPAALLMPMLTRRLGRRALFTIGLCGMSGSLFLMGLVPHWSAAGLAFIGISAMHSVVGPTSVVFQQEVVPFEWREVISGATTMAIGPERCSSEARAYPPMTTARVTRISTWYWFTLLRMR